MYQLSPRCPAGERLASCSEDDVAGDDREHTPHGQEPPPVQFDGEVKRNHPHLDQSHELRMTCAQSLDFCGSQYKPGVTCLTPCGWAHLERINPLVITHIVRAVVPLLPLHQDDLSHHQSGNEDEHHLCMHGLVAPVLHMQPLVLHPVEENLYLIYVFRSEPYVFLTNGKETSSTHFQFSLCVIFSRSSWNKGGQRQK